jgi:hypothetical protein
MRFRGQDDDQVEVRLSVDELVLIRKVLDEVCHGLQFSDNDFQVIFGITRGELEAFLQRTTVVLERANILTE